MCALAASLNKQTSSGPQLWDRRHEGWDCSLESSESATRTAFYPPSSQRPRSMRALPVGMLSSEYGEAKQPRSGRGKNGGRQG